MRRLRGEKFCSVEHLDLYAAQQAEIALERLAASVEDRPVATETLKLSRYEPIRTAVEGGREDTAVHVDVQVEVAEPPADSFADLPADLVPTNRVPSDVVSVDALPGGFPGELLPEIPLPSAEERDAERPTPEAPAAEEPGVAESWQDYPMAGFLAQPNPGAQGSGRAFRLGESLAVPAEGWGRLASPSAMPVLRAQPEDPREWSEPELVAQVPPTAPARAAFQAQVQPWGHADATLAWDAGWVDANPSHLPELVWRSRPGVPDVAPVLHRALEVRGATHVELELGPEQYDVCFASVPQRWASLPTGLGRSPAAKPRPLAVIAPDSITCGTYVTWQSRVSETACPRISAVEPVPGLHRAPWGQLPRPQPRSGGEPHLPEAAAWLDLSQAPAKPGGSWDQPHLRRSPEPLPLPVALHGKDMFLVGEAGPELQPWLAEPHSAHAWPQPQFRLRPVPISARVLTAKPLARMDASTLQAGPLTASRALATPLGIRIQNLAQFRLGSSGRIAGGLTARMPKNTPAVMPAIRRDWERPVADLRLNGLPRPVPGPAPLAALPVGKPSPGEAPVPFETRGTVRYSPVAWVTMPPRQFQLLPLALRFDPTLAFQLPHTMPGPAELPLSGYRTGGPYPKLPARLPHQYLRVCPPQPPARFDRVPLVSQGVRPHWECVRGLAAPQPVRKYAADYFVWPTPPLQAPGQSADVPPRAVA